MGRRCNYYYYYDHVGNVQMQEAAGVGDAAAAADVQGFEWAQLGHDTLGGRLLAYLRDQGATIPDWAVCRVPAGRIAVLAQLHDEFTGWWRLYSAQPADTPLPSDVTEQLDDAAQQVQTAYMDYVLLDARTLRSAKRGPADPGGASGPSRRQRQHRSRSTSSLMSLGSAPLHPGGASSGAPQLASLLAQFSLVDPWASKRGGAKGYTHPATPKPASPARLDQWYVSSTAAPWVLDVARTYGAPGDHNGVLLTLSLPDLPHAHREQWRFPTYLLFHPSLRLELEQRLEAHVAANPVTSTDPGGLHGVVLAADAAAALADRPGASAAQRQAAAMANLAVREERAAAAAASHNARAALMKEHGERGTRWFHRQADEPAAGAQEPITHLKVPGQPAPVALTGPGTRNTVSAAAAAMYSSTSPTGLFRVQPVCTASQQQLLAAIDRKVPADLQAAAEGSGDGALSDAELMAALAGSANGKAPESDGVPYEVYKAVSARLQPALDAVVDELQTAFITGRWIGDNALYLQGLIEWMRLDVGADGTPRQGGALYFLDIEKAYDRVHRQWLYASAEGLGFGPRMLRWIRLLTANGSARVCVNGMLSDAFPVLNGLPQGSTASPPLWVIQMQPLTSFLRRQVEQGALRTPLLPSGEQAPPAAHHADDTTLMARDPAVDGPVLMAAVQLFCRASNARVHPDKSKAMGLGRFAHLTGPCPHTGVPFTTGAVTHLGVPLSWDSDAPAGQDQEQTAVMRRYLAELADLNLQRQRRLQQQQQQQQQLQRQGQSPRPRTGSQVVVLATLGGQDGAGGGPGVAASRRGQRVDIVDHVGDVQMQEAAGVGDAAAAADVQGFEWAQLGHDTLGGRLLAYLRDQGATIPDWAVCRVPAGRIAVLAQLHDEFTGWWRLYSAQPADTPLPSDVTEQLDDAAQQVQTAYMDYVFFF
ncbi:hypothetical protein CHLRE_14g622410v5 [Chlamydomonas reinhardtii]|uniref:Reverse transcriptase domain-containing protein n=1 Tax=Chlamydomonas reinhardtii TaxID=3055 RepID=A0A2K3CY34_CHLRE|nr:uncharacterized protein CHLRE_14g622410v5 [Chlamydomonas reinhardtii]PNW73191.1 hypothetical protein CHLRE_14g622410v5 [Chlamydomonas reinhardtii]